MPRKPSEGNEDAEVSFSWPGRPRREEPGVVDVRLAARAQRQALREMANQPAEAPPGAPARQAPRPAQPPATRAQSTAASARERWIVTELRRQAVTTDAALREMSERLDQVGRTLRQIVDVLPKLQQGRLTGSASGARSAAADAALARRLDEFEARLEARFDELAGAASAGAAARAGSGTQVVTGDPASVKAQIKDEMTTITKRLGELGEHLRAELVTASSQAEVRLNRDRDQLREALNQTVGRINEMMSNTVTRDDLRQYWVEMAAKLAKQQELVVSEREQLRLDLAQRMDQLAAEREQLRKDVGERLARVAEAAAVRDRDSGADTRPIAAASAAQKASIDELRREMHQLGAQLLAATNPKSRATAALDGAVADSIKQSMADAAAALSSAASKNDVEALRNQLAGTVNRLEKSLVARFEQDERKWEEQLATALEAVQLALEGVELNRRAVLGEVSAAVRAALGGVLPPLATQ
jgi:hypothetical protein